MKSDIEQKAVLIISSDRAESVLYAKILERISRISVCEEKAAFDRLSSETPDLILIGRRAVTDPIEFCQKLRTFPETVQTPLIVDIISSNNPIIEQLHEVGVNDFLYMPVSPGELTAKCKALLK